jgi:hypothetical protein
MVRSILRMNGGQLLKLDITDRKRVTLAIEIRKPTGHHLLLEFQPIRFTVLSDTFC